MKRLALIAALVALTGATQTPTDVRSPKVMSPEWIVTWIKANINTNEWYFVKNTDSCLFFIKNKDNRDFDYSKFPNVTYFERMECFSETDEETKMPSTLSSIKANCKTSSVAIRKFTLYSRNNMTGDSETMRGYEKLKPTVPGSVGEDVLKTFCNFANKAIAVDEAKRAAEAVASTGNQ